LKDEIALTDLTPSENVLLAYPFPPNVLVRRALDHPVPSQLFLANALIVTDPAGGEGIIPSDVLRATLIGFQN
jgi:hypothetical protein